MKYRFFEHTADAKFQAYGKTLGEAFSNAAEAMTSIMIKPESVKPKTAKEITVEGKDEKALLYNFLEEFLFLLDTDGFILNKIRRIKITKNRNYLLEAEAAGDNAEKYETSGDVKAVTYSEMEIKKEKDKYMVQVVVDL